MHDGGRVVSERPARWFLSESGLCGRRRLRRSAARSGGRFATPATGHLDNAEELSVGERIEVAGSAGIVRETEPALGRGEFRALIELLPHSGDRS